MVNLHDIRYLRIGTPDLDAAIEFATRIVGLELAGREGKAAYFRSDIDLWHLATTKIMHNSFEFATNGGKNLLFHNVGAGKFEDVTDRMGVGSTRWSLAAASADFFAASAASVAASADFPAACAVFSVASHSRNVNTT